MKHNYSCDASLAIVIPPVAWLDPRENPLTPAQPSPYVMWRHRAHHSALRSHSLFFPSLVLPHVRWMRHPSTSSSSSSSAWADGSRSVFPWAPDKRLVEECRSRTTKKKKSMIVDVRAVCPIQPLEHTRSGWKNGRYSPRGGFIFFNALTNSESVASRRKPVAECWGHWRAIKEINFPNTD